MRKSNTCYTARLVNQAVTKVGFSEPNFYKWFIIWASNKRNL